MTSAKQKEIMLMIFRSSLIALIALLGFIYNPFKTDEPVNSKKEEFTLKTVMAYLDKVHFSPRSLDDSLSVEIYDNYLEFLDPGKRMLVQADIDRLQPYRDQLDNELENSTFDFFNLSEELYTVGLERCEKIFKEVIQGPIAIESDEQWIQDPENRGFAQSEEELRDIWENIIRYEVIKKVHNKEKALLEGEEKSLETLKKEAIEDVEETFSKFFERIGQVRRTDRFADYINSFTMTYDPHTNYFSPKEKEEFNISMSGSYEGIGARLRQEGEFIRIVEIIPGGPAWKQKLLEANDLIMAVAQEGEEAIDIRGWRQDDVVEIIRGKKDTRVTLTVKKTDESVVDIEILRDKVKIEEGKAQAMMLDLEGEIENVGYVKLPKFYFGTEESPGCAEDVRRNIADLVEDGAQAIILDLRNNSGGSLSEVVDMSGLFIDEGPIVQVKNRGRKPYVLRDKNPAVQYDGELLILVNHFSASASEIIAAALQDYDRAIVVGSSSTFGKGTVQRFHMLDRGVIGNQDIKPLGEVKITTQKFYRVNGGSTQLKGVVPDIVLPDSYNYINIGEKNYETSLGWTEIAPVDFEESEESAFDFEMLRQKSLERVQQNETFALVEERARFLEEKDKEVVEIPLDLQAYKQMLEDRKKENERFDDMYPVIEGLHPKVTLSQKDFIESEDGRKQRYEKLAENLGKDVYIQESLHILKDILSKS